MRLDLVVGPNGAGKSTFVELLLAPLRPYVPFVNADAIAAQRWPTDPQKHSYDAAKVAAETRSLLIDRREPFIAETVFSHPSKLDLISDAVRAGDAVTIHVLLVPEDLAVARVAQRVANGGHSVPEVKVRERYRRLWPLVVDAIDRSHVARVWDNSSIHGPVDVALFASGIPMGATSWPVWTPTALTARWPPQSATPR